MIAVTPTNLAGRILREVVRYPGELDAGMLAASLMPYPAPRPRLEVSPDWTPALRSRRYREWRSALGVWEEARHHHEVGCASTVSRTLGRLTEAGLVESRAAPILAEWARSAVAPLDAEGIAAWIGERRRLAADVDPDADDYDPATGGISPPADSAPVRLVLALVGRIEDPPSSARALVAAASTTGEPTTAAEEAYADLVRLGVIVPPSRRWPTLAGVHLVGRWA